MSRHLQPYPSYQETNSVWVDEIPSHWTLTTLGKVTVDKCDGPFGSGLKSEHYTDSGVQVVRLQNIKLNGYSAGTPVFIDSEYYDRKLSDHDVVTDDILIAGLGDPNNPVGRACVAPMGIEPAMVKADCFRFRIDPQRIVSSFAAYQLSASSWFVSGTLSNGSTRARVPLGLMSKRVFTYPPLDEQRQIAKFLDHETATIDALIEKQQQLIALLEEKRQAVISHAVTKGLNLDAPMRDSGVEWLGQVPAHWRIKRLKHISPRIGVGLVINPSTYTKDKGVYFIFGGDVKEYGFDLSNTRRIAPADSERLAPSRLNTADLICVRVGEPGVTAVVPPELEGANCASVIVIRQGNFDSDWLCAAMNSWVGRKQVGRVSYGAAQKQFNISDAVEFTFPVPPPEEQCAIAKHVLAVLDRFSKLTGCSAKMIELLKERRTARISAAVTGKIDVRHWTPPAPKTQKSESEATP